MKRYVAYEEDLREMRDDDPLPDSSDNWCVVVRSEDSPPSNLRSLLKRAAETLRLRDAKPWDEARMADEIDAFLQSPDETKEHYTRPGDYRNAIGWLTDALSKVEDHSARASIREAQSFLESLLERAIERPAVEPPGGESNNT